MKYLLPIFATAILAVTPSAHATEPFQLGEIGYAGNGCPSTTDNTQPTLVFTSGTAEDSNGGHRLTIIPTEMTLLFPSTGRTFERIKCDIAVPAKVTKGYQIGIQHASLMAFSVLDDDTKSSIRLGSSFSGQSSQSNEKELDTTSPHNTELHIKETQWARCGADVIIRAKASATLRGDNTQNAYVSVNSVTLKLTARQCSE